MFKNKKIGLYSLLFCMTIVSFLEAIDKERLKTFFKEYDLSAEKQNWSWQRLPYAIEKDYMDVAEFLILKGDPINSYREVWPSPFLKDRYDLFIKHPLLTAIKKDNLNLVFLITQTCTDISKAEEYNEIAVKFPSGDYQGSSVIIADRKYAIQIAMEQNVINYYILSVLLDTDIDINITNVYRLNNPPSFPNFYFTPLKSAISLKKLDIAHLLLSYNADVENCNNQNTTILAIAVDDNYIDGVKLLLSFGADPLKISYISNGMYSPLQLAMKKGYWDIVDVLLDAIVEKDSSYVTNGT